MHLLLIFLVLVVAFPIWRGHLRLAPVSNTSYYVAPDGEAGRDVYAVLLEAIEKTVGWPCRGSLPVGDKP